MNFNLGNWNQALKLSGSNYEVPEQSMQPPDPAQARQPFIPNNINDALAVSGSDYRVPQQQAHPWVMDTQHAASAVDAVPSPQAEGQGDGQTSYPGLKNSPAADLVRKAASAVAAFYTGGASALAMNAGGQVLSQNNSTAGAAAGAAGKAAQPSKGEAKDLRALFGWT